MGLKELLSLGGKSMPFDEQSTIRQNVSQEQALSFFLTFFAQQLAVCLNHRGECGVASKAHRPDLEQIEHLLLNSAAHGMGLDDLHIIWEKVFRHQVLVKPLSAVFHRCLQKLERKRNIDQKENDKKKQISIPRD